MKIVAHSSDSDSGSTNRPYPKFRKLNPAATQNGRRGSILPQHAADRRSHDEAEAECSAHHAVPACALFRRRDVRDVRVGGRQARRRDARDGAADRTASRRQARSPSRCSRVPNPGWRARLPGAAQNGRTSRRAPAKIRTASTPTPCRTIRKSPPRAPCCRRRSLRPAWAAPATIMPSASMSSTTVMKMKTNAARRGVAVGPGSSHDSLYNRIVRAKVTLRVDANLPSLGNRVIAFMQPTRRNAGDARQETVDRR